MSNEIDVNELQSWLGTVYEKVESTVPPSKQACHLVDLLKQSLVAPDLPPSLHTSLGLVKLKEAINDRNPWVAKSIDGLVDDIAAWVQSKANAKAALAIRRGNLGEAEEFFCLSDDPDGSPRVWRAILECPSRKIFTLFSNQLPPIPTEKLASIINRSQIPVKILRALIGPKADETLLELAPHLSYCDFRGLDETFQKTLLENCTADKIEYLLIHSNRIKALPKTMEAISYLDCSDCERLKGLPPDMAKLRKLNCRRCDQLTELPSGMVSLQRLNCSECQNLASLPVDMTALESLNCSKCETLAGLPAGMLVLRSLNCSSCDSLTSLPEDLPTLMSLNCSHCDRLASLPPEMAALKRLHCWGCGSLTSLPQDLLALTRLNCSWCDALTNLPADMPALKTLNCSGCDSLASLPAALPCCIRLEFCHCPLLVNTPTPEVPGSATVFRCILGSQEAKQETWQVPYDKVPLNPKAYLCQLGTDWLLEGLPFPSVAYLEKDEQVFQGKDYGGVRRDLISRILTHLFDQNLGKKKALLRSKNLFPLWQSDDENQLTAYRSLARLMALSFQHVCDLTTGPLFSERFYQALLTEPASLDRAAALMGLNAELLALAAETKSPEGNLSQEVKEKVLFYLDPEQKKFAHVDHEVNLKAALDYLKADPKILKKKIIAEMKLPQGQWMKINQVVDLIREELQLALDQKIWNQILETDGAHLKKEIEGDLSAKALWKHLDWDAEKSTEPETQNTKKYFKTWVQNAEKPDLEKFVLAVTANRSLTPARIIVQLYKRGPKNLPMAHSCLSTLELSCQLPDQKTFDIKMKQFLANALAGSGFQVA